MKGKITERDDRKGYVAFIDIDAPELGTSITLTVSLLEDD